MLLELISASALAALPKPVTGDFDYDGKQDIAEVVEQARGKYVLRVRRASRPRHPSRSTRLATRPVSSWRRRRAA